MSDRLWKYRLLAYDREGEIASRSLAGSDMVADMAEAALKANPNIVQVTRVPIRDDEDLSDGGAK